MKTHRVIYLTLANFIICKSFLNEVVKKLILKIAVKGGSHVTRRHWQTKQDGSLAH